MDARGNVTQTTLGNTVKTIYGYDTQTGWLESIDIAKGSSLLQYVETTHDNIGNVKTRRSNYASSVGVGSDFTESYAYDSHNRLTTRTISFTSGASSIPTPFQQTHNNTYDNWGNIKYRYGAGHYKYDTTKKHKLLGVYSNSSFTGSPIYSMSYDNNGNITSDGNRSFTYSSFDKATQITQTGASSNMNYGVDKELYYKQDVYQENGSSVTYKRYYIGAYEKVIRTGGNGNTTEHKYNIGNAVLTYRSGSNTISFIHKDNQGSVIATTNSSGVVQTQAIYDPFGVQTAVYQNSVYLTTYPPITDRGYTGHKQMNHLDIIHMKGRIYDPVLGRFLQADPHIQAPTNTQSYNRYSYVMNNPMSYTDPSGYFFKKLGKFVKKNWRTIASIAIAVYLPGVSWVAELGSVGAGALTGLVSGAVGTGSLKGALIGALTGGMFGQLHQMAPGFDKVIAHGAVGGIGSALSGGKFGHGFFSAGFTQAAGNIKGMFVDGATKIADRATNAIKAAMIGGTASKMSGGKFANGAMTGALSRLLNDDFRAPDEKDPASLTDGKSPEKFLEDELKGFDVEVEQKLQSGSLSYSENELAILAKIRKSPLQFEINSNGEVELAMVKSLSVGKLGAEAKVFINSKAQLGAGGAVMIGPYEIGVVATVQPYHDLSSMMRGLGESVRKMSIAPVGNTRQGGG